MIDESNSSYDQGMKDIKKGTEQVLQGLQKMYGLDISTEHFTETPARVSRAYAEILEGVKDTKEQVNKILSTAFESSMDNMIFIRNIHVFSICPHHVLPTEMYVDVAYLPDGFILGLSKLPRLVEVLAKRPVVQEQLTEEITEYLMSIHSRGAAARIVGQHFCMRMRGVKQPEAYAVTTSVRGAFKDNSITRQEFLNAIGEARWGG